MSLLNDVFNANKHAWAVRICGSYYPDAQCGTMVSDQFVAAYALSRESWVAYCRASDVHQEVEHTAGPSFQGPGGCNQYTVPHYSAVGKLQAGDVIYVLDEAHDWGEALVPIGTLQFGEASLVRPGAYGLSTTLCALFFGACLFYTMLHVFWSLAPKFRPRVVDRRMVRQQEAKA